MLWGYPSNVMGETQGLFGRTADGIAIINPPGNFIGAIIMFWILGFIPCWVVAKILDSLGLLRLPREVELAGLDTHDYGDAFPYFAYRDTAQEDIDRELARGHGD